MTEYNSSNIYIGIALFFFSVTLYTSAYHVPTLTNMNYLQLSTFCLNYLLQFPEIFIQLYNLSHGYSDKFSWV